jgi:nucleotide-binding universal stress UspA family protein
MFATIVHPTNLSPEGVPAFEHALRLALLNRSEFKVVHVAEPGEPTQWAGFPAVRDTLVRWGFLPLHAEQHDVLAQTGVAVEKVRIEADDILDALADFLVEHPADLLVMASHGRGGVEALFNPSVSAKLAHLTLMNTLIFGPHARPFVDAATGSHERIKRVLVAVDHSPVAESALRTLDILASGLGVEFDYLHVGGAAPILFDDGRQRPVRTVEGPVVETILAQAEHADLIALPMVGRKTLLDALRGSTTERIVREASRPVLALPV